MTIKENPQNAKNVYHFDDLDHQLHHHQASVNQMSGAGPLVQNALGSMLEILKQEVFNSTSVRNIIWGYDHPLIKLGNDVLPEEKKLEFANPPVNARNLNV